MTYAGDDSLTGTVGRDAVFMAESDAARLGLDDGGALRLVSAHGTFEGRCHIAPVKPGSLQVYWPEGNVLIGRRLDPASGEPDYNATVRVVRANRDRPRRAGKTVLTTAGVRIHCGDHEATAPPPVGRPRRHARRFSGRHHELRGLSQRDGTAAVLQVELPALAAAERG